MTTEENAHIGMKWFPVVDSDTLYLLCSVSSTFWSSFNAEYLYCSKQSLLLLCFIKMHSLLTVFISLLLCTFMHNLLRGR